MTLRAPKRLRKAPLVEAIFELRFEGKGQATGDLLPGLLFNALGNEFPTVTALPTASVPREIRAQNDELRFLATHRLEGSSRIVQVGDRVISLSQLPPYEGWEAFSPRILRVLEAIEATELVAETHRISMRCLNVLSAPKGHQLDLVNLELLVAGRSVTEQGFALRTELVRNGYTNVIQIKGNVNSSSPTAVVSDGLLVDIDTIREVGSAELRKDRERLVQSIHEEIRQTFFELLTPETIKSLEPEWEGGAE